MSPSAILTTSCGFSQLFVMRSVASEATEFSFGSVKSTLVVVTRSGGVHPEACHSSAASPRTFHPTRLQWCLEGKSLWKAIDYIDCAGGNGSEALSLLGQKIPTSTDIIGNVFRSKGMKHVQSLMRDFTALSYCVFHIHLWPPQTGPAQEQWSLTLPEACSDPPAMSFPGDFYGRHCGGQGQWGTNCQGWPLPLVPCHASVLGRVGTGG